MTTFNNTNTQLYTSGKHWQGITVAAFHLSSGELPENELLQHHLTINTGTTGYAQHRSQKQWHTTQYNYGAIGFIPAGQTNEPRWNFNSSILTISLSATLYSKGNYVATRGVIDNDITRIAILLAAEANAGAGASQLLGESMAIALQTLLYERYSTMPDQRALVQEGLSGAQIARVIEYCKTHLQENVSLQELAALCHVSPFHFLRQFKKRLGVAPYQLMTRLRMDAAKQQLLASDMPLNELTYLLGFTDPAHFSRTFKKHTGEAPGVYRMKNRSSRYLVQA